MKNSTKKIIMGTAVTLGSWASSWHAGKLVNDGIKLKKPGTVVSGLLMATGAMITANMGGELIGTGITENLIDMDESGKFMEFAENHGLIYNVRHPDSKDDIAEDE